MRDQKDLDRLLDSALSTYADPGPDSGLEQRILSRVTSARESVESAPAPRRHWLLWAIALPAAACLLLFFLLPARKARTPQPNPDQLHQANSSKPAPVITERRVPSAPIASVPAQPIQVRAHPAKANPVRVAARIAPLPKRDVFPTPQPLTPEEQALCAFATQVPEAQRQAVIEAQKKVEQPLSIAAIEIPPIQLPAEGNN